MPRPPRTPARSGRGGRRAARRVLSVVAAAAAGCAMSSDASVDAATSLVFRTAAGVPGDAGAGEVDAARAARSPRSTVAPRDVYVVRMVPDGYRPDPAMTTRAIRRAVSGASDYWSEQTRGAVSFRLVAVSDWVPSAHRCDDVAGLWAQALRIVPEAARPETHLVVVAPAAAGEDGTGCDYGFGSLGSADSGGSTYVTALRPQLLAHELGHNLGLGHAAALECAHTQDGRADGTSWSSGCVVREYDDLYDVMGYSGEGFGDGNLGAVGIDRLGADPDGVRTVTASTSGIRLQPISRIDTGVRVLKVMVPGEPVYYVEYRTAAGRDRGLASGPWHPSTGVRILREDPSGEGSLELDTSPGGRRYDRGMAAGRSFTSASGAIRITATQEDPRGAVVDVVLAAGQRR